MKRPRPPKSMCMHVTSIPICMKFLRRFYIVTHTHMVAVCEELTSSGTVPYFNGTITGTGSNAVVKDKERERKRKKRKKE